MSLHVSMLMLSATFSANVASTREASSSCILLVPKLQTDLFLTFLLRVR